MLWWRMCRVAGRLLHPYYLVPWASPLLRWRMETYGIVDERGQLLCATDVTPVRFMRFLITQRQALVRFLRWAALLDICR